MSLDVQLASLLASVFMGLGLGASLDTYERILGKRTSFQWLRVINDFLFWIAQALLYFGLLLYMNQGDVRLYLLFALLLGYSMYRALFESSYRKLLDVLLRIGYQTIQIVIQFTYVFLINPTKGLLKLLYRLGMIVLLVLWRIVSTVIYWIFRPILLLIIFVDKKSGQPFLKQRMMIFKAVKHYYQRIAKLKWKRK